MPSIDIPFAIGQEVWFTGGAHEEERVTCPECLGSRRLTLTLGNGDSASLECAMCKSGYDPPRGFLIQRVYVRKPRKYVCRRLVRVDGDEVLYSDLPEGAAAYTCAYAKDLFATEEECQKRCDELNEQARKEEAARVIHNLESSRHDLSHSVYYWRRKKKELERDLAAVNERLGQIKQKAKKRLRR